MRSPRTYFDNELTHISGAVYDDSGRLSVDGISMAETLAASCDSFFVGYGITAEELPANPDLIEPLLSGQMQTLLASMNSRSCGGVFLLLDATVRPDAENAENSRAGIFLKKTQPTSTQSVGVKNHYLRGPAQAARDHGVELLANGAWSLTFRRRISSATSWIPPGKTKICPCPDSITGRIVSRSRITARRDFCCAYPCAAGTGQCSAYAASRSVTECSSSCTVPATAPMRMSLPSPHPRTETSYVPPRV